MIENTGFENGFQIPEIKEKIKNTMLEKYGVEYYTKTEEFKEKYNETIIEKYGSIENYHKQKYENYKKHVLINMVVKIISNTKSL